MLRGRVRIRGREGESMRESRREGDRKRGRDKVRMIECVRMCMHASVYVFVLYNK